MAMVVGGMEAAMRWRTSGSGGCGSFNGEAEGGCVVGGLDREMESARDRCSRRVKRKRDRGVRRDGLIRFIGIGWYGFSKAIGKQCLIESMSMEGLTGLHTIVSGAPIACRFFFGACCLMARRPGG